MYICQRAATGTHLPVVAMAEWRNGRSWLRDPGDDDDECYIIYYHLWYIDSAYLSSFTSSVSLTFVVCARVQQESMVEETNTELDSELD